MTTVDPQSDHRREQALRRLEKRGEFRNHLAAYVMVNTLLVIVWAMVGGGFFWPIFPLFGWGIGLFFHGLDTYGRPPSEERIRREMDRLP